MEAEAKSGATYPRCAGILLTAQPLAFRMPAHGDEPKDHLSINDSFRSA